MISAMSPVGTFDLSFSAAGYATEWFDNATDGNRGSIVIAKSTETSLPVTTADAALAGNATISGTVTNDDSGDPVEGATVTLYEDGGIVSVDSKVTAADGTYEFAVVPGEYDLKFTAPSMTPNGTTTPLRRPPPSCPPSAPARRSWRTLL